MAKMSFTDNQTAFEYVLYMIAASYFDKAVCLSVPTEKNMLLHYKEQSINRQYSMEDFCIGFMDNLVKKLPSGFFNHNMEVKLNMKKEGLTEIIFSDQDEVIAFQAVYEGNKTQINYQIWIKNKKPSKKSKKTTKTSKKAA